jgi:predicted glycoside hydrolase/deacetylase ChbG (UPF0249 family)
MASPTKRLIVTAQGFGRAPGANRGILKAHKEGIVTSATLEVQGANASEAATLGRETTTLGLGIAFVFTAGQPLLPPAEVPSLVDPQGRLHGDVKALAGARLDDVLAEARTQLRRFRELVGTRPTHLDAHASAQAVPVVLEALLTLAWETGLPIRSVTPAMRERLRYERIATPDHLIDDFSGAEASVERLARALADVPLGTSELLCRPAEPDPEDLDAPLREAELRILTDPEARQAVQAGGIKLVAYGAA